MLQTSCSSSRRNTEAAFLHDGGGDRSETVKLIQLLVKELTSRGYQCDRFTAHREERAMRSIRRSASTDTMLLANDRIVFEAIYICELFLASPSSPPSSWRPRVFLVSVLAVISKYKSRHAKFDDAYRPAVSVGHPGLQRAEVISRTIRAFCNRYEGSRFIVVDDGSSDGTSDEVARDFADHRNVRLLRRKMAARPRRSIAELRRRPARSSSRSTGHDLRPHTIAYLVRHFANDGVGAVAGNVKVGIASIADLLAVDRIRHQPESRSARVQRDQFVSARSRRSRRVRRAAIVQAGGYTPTRWRKTWIFDVADLRHGWRIETDSDAVDTPKPHSFSALSVSVPMGLRNAAVVVEASPRARRTAFGSVMLRLGLFHVLFQRCRRSSTSNHWTVSNVVGSWLWHGQQTRYWQPLPRRLASANIIGSCTHSFSWSSDWTPLGRI